ncbi:amidoligase family protein [Roseibium limicola]|uniref:Amidoligase family protein n=1 Tax=Roseibium limicola TaxID=2816037 RepID=A0A939ER00_9HYPH|nr:amidoligase family protein [Roseibium limicola]MBO0345484.1 amidoligase family protein [Roseibium limicola]
MQDFRDVFFTPPHSHTTGGELRRVGVELEFAAVSARASANVVQTLFGGNVRELDPHRFEVVDTEFGDFTCELDSQYVHDNPKDANADPSELKYRLRRSLQELFGDVSSLLVPCEVVCPPIVTTDLPKLAGLVSGLEEAGASGTRENVLYAFGAQFNPEIIEPTGDHIASVLKAYVLLSAWLRKIVDVDPTRRLTSFADPFPPSYQRKIVAPDYWPGLDDLMDMHLKENPTRNRELDMLPLFAHLDEKKVAARVNDPLIKARPTFHYRLPDARLGDPAWSLALEWNRWLMVERLANDRDKLNAMAEDFLRLDAAAKPKPWAWRASEWMVLA